MSTNPSPFIVFVHGILGFSSLNILGKQIGYFRGLKQHFAQQKYAVYFPALPPVGAIKQRATVLADFLQRAGDRPVHLIAHSMGGLDSRHLISHLDPQHQVKQLITIATPHRGTPLAEWLLRDPGLINAIGRRIATPGLRDLTPQACEQFNQATPNRPDVCYQSYAGVRTTSEVPMIFKAWSKRLDQCAGDNDSQVPLVSAQWGEFLGRVRADHMELVGWSLGLPNKSRQRPHDHRHFFTAIIERIS